MSLRLVLRAALAAFVLAGCFDFQKDLGTCRDQHRCGDAGDAGDAGATPRTTLGVCDQGVCWEAPTPTSLPLTGVASTGPGDWWFSTSTAVAFHYAQGTWSMAWAGVRPKNPDQWWSNQATVVACAGAPWLAVWDHSGVEHAWTLVDGGFVEGERLTDGEGNNSGQVNVGWSGAGGACAWGGEVQQSYFRPWLAEGTTNGPVATWELDELGTGDSVTALGGPSADQLWLAIDGTRRGGLYRRAADGGFEYALPRPRALSGVSGVCALASGAVLAAGPEGVALADPAGGGALLGSTTGVQALACTATGFVAAGDHGLLQCADVTRPCAPAHDTAVAFTAMAQAGDTLVAASSSGDVQQLAPTPATWSSGTRQTLEDVWVDASGDGYAVGDGVVLRRTPAGWVTLVKGPSVANATTVRGLADGGVMVLGLSLGATISPTGELTPFRVRDAQGVLVQGVFPLATNTAAQAPDGTWWAVGSGPQQYFQVLHLVGDTFHEVPVDGGPDPLEMHCLTFAPNGEGWAAGRDAKVWHYAPDTGWAFQWADTHFDTYTAALAARGTVWVAGGHGKAAQLVDGGWVPRDFPDGQDDIRLLYDGPDTLHAVGRRHRYSLDTDGFTWLFEPGLPVDTDRLLTSGTVAGDRGWVVGERGTIVSFPR